MENIRKHIIEASTWVVKVGSRSLTGEDGRLDRAQVANLASQLITLSGEGQERGFWSQVVPWRVALANWDCQPVLLTWLRFRPWQRSDRHT